MKEQTYISFLENKDGNIVSFERWPYKRLGNVKNAILRLWESPLYRVGTKGAVIAKVYATPDGCDRDRKETPTLVVTLPQYD